MSLAALLIVSLAPVAQGAAPAPTPPSSAEPGSPTGPNTVPTSSSPAATTTVTAKGDEEKEAKVGFHLEVELGHSVTTATFLAPERHENEFVGADLSLVPSYSFEVRGIKLMGNVSAAISYEYTLPDNETARRVEWKDLRFGLSAPGLYKNEFTGISFSPTVSLTAPITMESWVATTITSLGVSLSAKRSIGPVGVSLGVNGSKAFHLSPLNALRAAGTDAQGHLIQVRRPDDPFAAVNSTNASGSIGVSLGLSFQPTEELSLAARYSLSKSFKYHVAGADEFTPRGTRANGEPIAVTGVATSDRSTFDISAGYALTERYSISLGLATGQSPVDGQGRVRFPFFSTGNAALGVTSINLGLSAAF
jgi:hypothetical protein